jgi:hypothetical protein
MLQGTICDPRRQIFDRIQQSSAQKGIILTKPSCSISDFGFGL